MFKQCDTYVFQEAVPVRGCSNIISRNRLGVGVPAEERKAFSIQFIIVKHTKNDVRIHPILTPVLVCFTIVN